MQTLNISQYKHPFRVLILLFCFIKLSAQSNLAPNGNFEQYLICPFKGMPFHNASPSIWFKPDWGGGAYFNSCANPTETGAPYNLSFFGSYQLPHSGNGYIAMHYEQSPSSNIRNYFGVKLLDSLKAGHCYYAEYYVSLFNDVNIGCNNQAMLFTKKAIYADTLHSNYFIIANPQIKNYGNPIIIDTLNWIKVSGIFTAQGGEQYLTLGNFNNGSSTNIKLFQTTGIYAATYYADDVSVYEIDTFKLNADAGADKTIANGDSVFIGCLTNGITNIIWRDANNNIINTQAPGFYVTPSSNTFYTVEQTVCGFTSKDTVYINVLLPLKFISYSVSLLGTKQSIENTWQTANEINVSHFNIQRSLNGKDFITIGKVTAQNKSYNEYSFTDELKTKDQYPKTFYYRIESIDFDGKKQYSTIKQITIKPQTPNIVLYPNPAKDFIIIECKGAKEVFIIDNLGRIILQLNNITEHQTINTKQLSKGLYLLKVITANGATEIAKFVKE